MGKPRVLIHLCNTEFTLTKLFHYAPVQFALVVVLVLASSTAALPEERRDIDLYFENDVCLRIDGNASELGDVQTFQRFSLNAPRGLFLRATRFDLDVPSASEPLSVAIPSASKIVGELKGSYYGQCSFSEFEAGFVRQIDGTGSCSVIGNTKETFHSAPGSEKNVIVDCRPELPGICTKMTLTHIVGAVRLRVVAIMREPNPDKWKPISNELRAFLDGYVRSSPRC